MEIEKNKENIEVEEPQQGCGEILTAERKKQNKSIEEVAATLNLSVTQLKTIEQDKLEGLPEPTYVRGYIRAYAMLLGLDPVEILEHYQNSNWDSSTSLNGLPRGLNNGSLTSSGNVSSWIKWLIIFTLIGLLIYFWMSGKASELFSDKPQQEQNSVIELADAPALGSNAQEKEVQVDAEALSPNSKESDSDDLNITESSLESEGSLGDESESASQKNNLLLTFSDTSWIDIRDENDERLAYKSYANGDELAVSSDLPISVFIGNAAGVNVKYNDENFDIAEHQEGVYAKFIVGEE